MSEDAPNTPNAAARQWVEPTLTKHESLSAMTQQNYGPYAPPPPGYYPPGYPIGVFGDTIPGSTGFFVG